MPNEITGVQITPHPTDPTYSIQVGINVYTGQSVAALFDFTQFDPMQLIDNIRLKRIIGGYTPAALFSDEFRGAINAKGIRTAGGDYFNVSFEQNPDESYRISFATSRGAEPSQVINVFADDLIADSRDLSSVRRNVKAFLRIAGYTDLTTPAPSGVYAGKTAAEAVALQTFRY